MPILICLFVGVVAVFFLSKSDEDYIVIPSGIIVLICGVLLLMGLIALPSSRIEYQAKIRGFNAIQQTATTMRETKTREYESAAFQLEIAKMNKWLAETKYWNSTIFDIWIPDEIEKLEPLK